MRKTLISFLIILAAAGTGYSQSLEDILEDQLEDSDATEYTLATFKAGRIINGHSVENTQKGDLLFLIGHRFGTLNSGFYNFFGLDVANTRLGLDYGITDMINVGIGRSTYQKTWDGFMKIKVLRQGTGPSAYPVTFTLLLGADVNTFRDPSSEIDYTFINRLSYVSQALVARKFGSKFSIQLSPTYIHINLVEKEIDQNNIFAVGTGARFKLNSRISLSGEYYYLLPGQTADDYKNSASIGINIETGGHVFQLHLTNARSMIERGFIVETEDGWMDGGIHFGFNIARNFGLQNKY